MTEPRCPSAACPGPRLVAAPRWHRSRECSPRQTPQHQARCLSDWIVTTTATDFPASHPGGDVLHHRTTRAEHPTPVPCIRHPVSLPAHCRPRSATNGRRWRRVPPQATLNSPAEVAAGPKSPIRSRCRASRRACGQSQLSTAQPTPPTSRLQVPVFAVGHADRPEPRPVRSPHQDSPMDRQGPSGPTHHALRYVGRRRAPSVGDRLSQPTRESRERARGHRMLAASRRRRRRTSNSDKLH